MGLSVIITGGNFWKYQRPWVELAESHSCSEKTNKGCVKLRLRDKSFFDSATDVVSFVGLSTNQIHSAFKCRFNTVFRRRRITVIFVVVDVVNRTAIRHYKSLESPFFPQNILH